MRVSITLGLLGLIAFQGVAAAPKPVPAPSAPTQEVLILKAELAATLAQYDALLSTVYWSLGVVAGIAILLVSYGWVTNFRIYEREQKALKDELLTLIANEQAESRRIFSEKAVGLHETIGTTMQELTKSEFKALKSEISSIRAEFRGLMDDANIEIVKLHRDSWRAQDVRSNAVLESLEILEIAQRIGSDWRISETLDEIKTDLEVIADKSKGHALDSDTTKELVKLLKKCGPHYEISARAIFALLDRIAASN